MFSIDATLAVNLLESAPDALLVVDQAGRVVLVNRRAEELFGRARDAASLVVPTLCRAR